MRAQEAVQRIAALEALVEEKTKELEELEKLLSDKDALIAVLNQRLQNALDNAIWTSEAIENEQRFRVGTLPF